MFQFSSFRGLLARWVSASCTRTFSCLTCILASTTWIIHYALASSLSQIQRKFKLDINKWSNTHVAHFIWSQNTHLILGTQCSQRNTTHRQLFSGFPANKGKHSRPNCKFERNLYVSNFTVPKIVQCIVTTVRVNCKFNS
jgi:hypothetical protein